AAAGRLRPRRAGARARRRGVAGGVVARVLRGEAAARAPRAARAARRVDRGPAGVTHDIPLERANVHGHFSCELPPILTIDTGDTLRFATLDAGWHSVPQAQHFDDLDPERDGGHALIGPVELRGATAGATLEVRVDAVDVADWGITFGDGEGMLWSLDTAAGTGTGPAGATVALAPFLGVLGMPPAEPGVHSTIPPRR